MNSELTISPGELFYGLGETFGPFVKNGMADFNNLTVNDTHKSQASLSVFGTGMVEHPANKRINAYHSTSRTEVMAYLSTTLARWRLKSAVRRLAG